MTKQQSNNYQSTIQASGIDIYSTIEVGDANFWIPTMQLEELLNQGLIGLDLSGYAIRTRSKVVKQHVCRALGYPIPKSFK